MSKPFNPEIEEAAAEEHAEGSLPADDAQGFGNKHAAGNKHAHEGSASRPVAPAPGDDSESLVDRDSLAEIFNDSGGTGLGSQSPATAGRSLEEGTTADRASEEQGSAGRFSERPASEERASAEEEKSKPDELRLLRFERDSLFDRYARLQAEFENYRKRSQREQADFRQYASAEALKAILPVLDNFDLALKAGGKEADLRTGVELIRKQLSDILEKLGLTAIPTKGEKFDPHVHEAIEMIDTSEAEDNTVLDELQRGYRLKDRMLRPAVVRVARNRKH